MANYENNNEHNAKGLTIAIGVHLLLLLAFFFSSMAIPEKEPEKITGIIVNFGDAKAGTKVAKPSTSANSKAKPKPVEQQQSSASSAASEPIIDQKIEEVKAKEAFSLSTEKNKDKEKSKEKDKKKTADKKSPKKQKKQEDKPKEKPEKTEKPEEKPKEKPKKEEPKLDNRALFTKRDNNTQETKVSEGNEQDIFTDKGKSTEKTATQDANVYSNQYASELSSKGITANLSGRNLKYIPDVKKRFQKYGIVVVKIKVDQSGKVIQVTQDIGKSTTNDPSLVKIALDTANKALFNQDFNASVRQNGSITFEFKVE